MMASQVDCFSWTWMEVNFFWMMFTILSISCHNFNPYSTFITKIRNQGSGSALMHLFTKRLRGRNLGCDGSGSGLLPQQVHHVGRELAAGLVVLLQLLSITNKKLN